MIVMVSKADPYLVSLPAMPECPVHLVPFASIGSGVVGGEVQVLEQSSISHESEIYFSFWE